MSLTSQFSQFDLFLSFNHASFFIISEFVVTMWAAYTFDVMIGYHLLRRQRMPASVTLIILAFL